jgi:hypothetical protein
MRRNRCSQTTNEANCFRPRCAESHYGLIPCISDSAECLCTRCVNLIDNNYNQQYYLAYYCKVSQAEKIAPIVLTRPQTFR